MIDTHQTKALTEFMDRHFAHLDARVLPSKARFLMGVYQRGECIVIEFNPSLLAQCSFSTEEIQALAAHEMAHWEQGHTRAAHGIHWSLGSFACLALVFVWPLASLAGLGTLHLAKAAQERTHEYLADSVALAWTTPKALAGALAKIEGTLGEPAWHWFRSHPRLAARIETLKQARPKFFPARRA